MATADTPTARHPDGHGPARRRWRRVRWSVNVDAVLSPTTPLVLVGLMGAGKSTVGSRLAEATGRELVDVDVAITARTGKTVRELWEEGGEAAYRGLESAEVLDALRRVAVVVAAPGGVILDPVVREALDAAHVVWLRADPTVLGARVHAGDHRPLIGADPTADLASMADDRSALYESVADLVVDTAALGPDAAADAILASLPPDRPGR